MTIHFSCTQCGKCCHNLRLPLSLDEAADWLRRGGDVELFCEAIPWPLEPPASDAEAAYKRSRSFAAQCGALPIRVIVTVVASFDGACPHLLSDGRCGGYEERPRTCRIYPAEVNPFITLNPASKACPPDAWSTDKPVFLMNAAPLDAETNEVIRQARAATVQDVPQKARLCAELNVSTVALANEGFAIHAFARDVLAAALERVRHGSDSAPRAPEWRFISNRRATLDTLESVEAGHLVPASLEAPEVRYMAFFPDDL